MSRNPRSGTFADLAVLLLVDTVASIIRWQGWRSKVMMNLDMLPYNVGAAELLKSGRILDRGDVGSYLSYNPPGTVYLMLPGVALIKDPRLWEVPATFLMSLAALVFLYLISRTLFGRAIALTAATVFGLSLIGAPSILPLGHPAFLVAIIYFLMRWVRDRAPWALPVAAIVCAFGLYVDLGILPIILIFPILWFLYRPPISIGGVAVSAAAATVIWFPYLQFQVAREFVDLRSILLLQPVPALQSGVWEPAPMYCNTSLPGRSDTWEAEYQRLGLDERGTETAVYPSADPRAFVRYRVCRLLVNLDRNFDANFFVLGASTFLNVALWMSFLVGLVAILIAAGRHWRRVATAIERIWTVSTPATLVTAAVAAFAAWLLLSPGLLARCCSSDGSFDSQTTGVISQIRAFVPLVLICVILGTRFSQRWEGIAASAVGPVAIGFVVPWLIMVVVAEPNRAVRFWWLWPMEVLTLVVGAVSVADTLPFKRAVAQAILALTVLLTLPRLYIQERIENWSDSSYGGGETGQLATVDFLGGVAAARGQSTITVGYDIDAYPSIVPFHAATQDPLYRRGSWFDFLLRHRWGVTNENGTVDGLADQDQFRVWQRSADRSADPTWLGFAPLVTHGQFTVFQPLAP